MLNVHLLENKMLHPIIPLCPAICAGTPNPTPLPPPSRLVPDCRKSPKPTSLEHHLTAYQIPSFLFQVSWRVEALSLMPNAVLGMGIVGVRSGDPNIRNRPPMFVYFVTWCAQPLLAGCGDTVGILRLFDVAGGGNQEKAQGCR